MNHSGGICVAGNMIVDISYPVDVLPKSGELVPITGEAIRTTGGAVCNVSAASAAMRKATSSSAISAAIRTSTALTSSGKGPPPSPW